MERLRNALYRAVWDVSTSSDILEGNVEAVARHLTEVAAQVTGVARANVWLFNEAEDELHCIDLYDASTGLHTNGLVMREREFPREFTALKQRPYVDAHQPRADPRQPGYFEGYLKAVGITSSLDTVVEASGKHFGLLCLEHTDGPHQWSSDEITFAARLADKIAVTLSVSRARQATDEVRALARLAEESRDLFASVVENVPARVFWKDANLRFLGCNSLFARDAGFARAEDLIGKDDFQMPWRDQADKYRDDDRLVIESGAPRLNIEEPQTFPDGRTVWLRTSKVPWHGADGKTIGILGMYDDITERKAAEEHLRENEQRFRGYFETSLIGMAVTLPDKGIAEINARFCEILGYPREQLLRMDWAAVTHPDDLPADVDKFSRLLSGEIDSYELDKRFIRRSGATAYCTISVSGVRRADGSVNYLVAMVRDVTERKLAAEALHTALTSTVEVIAATIETRDPYTAGHQRVVADLAAAIAREMGLPAHTIEGIHFGALIHDLGKIQVPAELLSKPTRLSQIEMALMRTHPQAGYDIVKDIKFPWPVAEMVHQHHERLDGSGYPQGLKGDEIAMEARILTVADIVEAMASHRPYRPGLGVDKALEEIQDKRGRWYEPAAVDACVRLFREKGFQFKKGTFG